MDQNKLNQSIDNLLHGCMKAQSGDSILIVLEPEPGHRYDPAVGRVVADRAKTLGCEVQTVTPDPTRYGSELPNELLKRIETFQHTLFFSRLGDFARFDDHRGTGSRTMCYARSLEVMASDFCTIPHDLMQELLDRLETRLSRAETWSITCPAGTRLRGNMRLSEDDLSAFSMNFFPVTTFVPIPCSEAFGRVALSRWLLPVTAPRVFPAMVPFPGVVMGEVEAGGIKAYHGDQQAVDIIHNHYEQVGEQLGFNSHYVHSWHTGMNPMTRFDRSADDHLEEWESISFASPAYLHFHTAGEQAPGEVAWSVFNPTVCVDSEEIIRDGQMIWFQRAENLDLIRDHDCFERLTGKSAGLGL